MVVTGASEHIGRHLLDAVRANYQVYGIADCPREDCGVPAHSNIVWFEADVTDGLAVEKVFDQIATGGGVDVVIYLVSPRGLTGSGEDARRRINEEGLRVVLEASRRLAPKRFIVASPADEDRPAPSPGAAGPGAEQADRAAETPESLLARYTEHFPTSRIRFEARPRLLLIGASGFIGKHLVEAVKEDYRVIGVARSSQHACGVPVHPNVSWLQTDIGDAAAVAGTFHKILGSGSVDRVVHLAAYYDFSGDDHPEYTRTNVEGLRNVLEECRRLKPRSFLFASSVAACEFPEHGRVLNESTPADGRHPYAASKRVGEEMLDRYRDDFPSIIVRLGAVFSDWCEYPPVFVSLERWRSTVWDRRVLGGKGGFAVPYIHLRDTETFFTRAMARAGELDPGEIVIASTDTPVSLRQLFELATRYYFGGSDRPIDLPKMLCIPGMYLRDLAGRMLGQRPFERPWMGHYIDRTMPIDASRTRQRLAWSPRERFELLRRMPFIIGNLKRDPVEWHHRNQTILRRRQATPNLVIHRLLDRHQRDIEQRLEVSLQATDRDAALARHCNLSTPERRWTHRAALHQLMNAVRTQEMDVYLSFCHDLAERRFGDGFVPGEINAVLQALGRSCVDVVLEDPEAADLADEIRDRIQMTTLFGCDQIEESFDSVVERQVRRQQGLSRG